jgi:uncharacterized protein (TIGR01319 family)
LDRQEPKSLLITDCGSTTTKAILIEKIDGEYRQTFRGEAPTTVEAPFDDVTIGVLNSATEVEELSGRKIAKDGGVNRPDDGTGKNGVDLYLSTSSAGGGLQMSVAGVVGNMTAQSARNAALGAGAIVMDVLAIDDGRKPYERIRRLRHLRPDIVLLAGGTDGGTKAHVVELAETILAADPRPRFGVGFQLPVIYAGNIEAREDISTLLSKTSSVECVSNIRPTLEEERPEEAREAIHEAFLQHVMSHAPGYPKLMEWTDSDIMSTPNAVGSIMRTVAEQENISILGVDIGGATTDIFTVFWREDEKGDRHSDYHRTVSANLGMSYSICNVLLETGIDNIMRWLPFPMEGAEIKNRLRNKMIRPTTIPQSLEDLLVEHAVAREALRLALNHHKKLATGLMGIAREGDLSDMGGGVSGPRTVVDMMELKMAIGSGGVLSHAPTRAQAAHMMLDAWQLEGITFITVDSIFMMPHLGVFSQVLPEGATQVFKRDCLLYLGTAIAPAGQSKKIGDHVAEIVLEMPGGTENVDLRYGDLKVLPLDVGQEAQVMIKPGRRFDVGEGKGKEISRRVIGGLVGVIIDGRGRPLPFAAETEEQVKRNQMALEAFGLSWK